MARTTLFSMVSYPLASLFYCPCRCTSRRLVCLGGLPGVGGGAIVAPLPCPGCRMLSLRPNKACATQPLRVLPPSISSPWLMLYQWYGGAVGLGYASARFVSRARRVCSTTLTSPEGADNRKAGTRPASTAKQALSCQEARQHVLKRRGYVHVGGAF